MGMIEFVIIATLMTAFFDAFLDKFGFWYWLDQYGAKSGKKFIYSLSCCRLCKLFHLGWFSFALCYFLDYMGIIFVLIPFCVSGAFKLINYDSRN